MATAHQRSFNGYKSDRLFLEKRAIKERLKKPSGYKFEQHILSPAPLSESEANSLLSILCNTPGVTYKPRHRVESKSNGIEPHRWEMLGFDSHYHYGAWLGFNDLDLHYIDRIERDSLNNEQ